MVEWIQFRQMLQSLNEIAEETREEGIFIIKYSNSRVDQYFLIEGNIHVYVAT